MENTIITDRLRLDLMTMNDHLFMMELVNTDGWLKYVGDRSVHSAEDAQRYVHKLVTMPGLSYRVIRLKDDNTQIGVVSFMKADDVPHADLGFALLPEYYGKGYAYEAANVVQQQAIVNGHHLIQGTVVRDNISSIKLLTRLGFTLKEEMEEDGVWLLVYEYGEA